VSAGREVITDGDQGDRLPWPRAGQALWAGLTRVESVSGRSKIRQEAPGPLMI